MTKNGIAALHDYTDISGITKSLSYTVLYKDSFFNYSHKQFYFIDSSTATAQATVAPTIGLLPIPISPIISTWAGTEEEPAN